jgi:hypothetical protein
VVLEEAEAAPCVEVEEAGEAPPEEEVASALAAEVVPEAVASREVGVVASPPEAGEVPEVDLLVVVDDSLLVHLIPMCFGVRLRLYGVIATKGGY